jgi:putative copper resistance protein D
VLIATGLVNLQPLVTWTPWPGLTTSPWGWLLLAKFALFVAMLALAAANRFVLTPRLRDVSGSADGHLAAVRRSLALETGLAFTIAALVSILGTLAPPALA